MRKTAFILALWGFIACGPEKETIFFDLKVEAAPEDGGTVTFPDGPFESGQQVELTATPAEGYLFSGWSGDASGTANPLTITMNAGKRVVALFEKKTYNLEILVEGQGSVREEIVQNARTSHTYPHGTLVRLTAEPSEGWFFEKWEGDASGVLNPVELDVDRAKSVKAVFREDKPVDLVLEDGKRSLYVSEQYKVKMQVKYASGRVDYADNSELTMTSIGGVGEIRLRNDTILAVRSGGTGIIARFRGFTKTFILSVSAVEEVELPDEFLLTPATGAGIIVPVVVINYLPTLDGINLDMNRAPDDYWELKYSTLAEAKRRIEGELRITKFGIEEGTRFRQFNSLQKVDPYVGIRVVKYFNVYEMKMTEWHPSWTILKTPDYHDLFPKLGMENLVNNAGVKEVWITMFNKDGNFPSVEKGPYNDPSTYYGIPESNMSSPFTGDISNSWRLPNDLPVYARTYVVYGNSGHRGADTNLHNRGHQIEAQLYYMDERQGITMPGDRLFWHRFVGVDPMSGVIKPLGRAGMTHFPPNTSVDYDYANPALVNSDIRNWEPDGGRLEQINYKLWTNVPHDFNLVNTFYLNGTLFRNEYTYKPETQWLMYWWQSIPGKGNNIFFRGHALTNWWDVFYNWDEVVQAHGGLLRQNSAARRSGDPSAPGALPVCTHYAPPSRR